MTIWGSGLTMPNLCTAKTWEVSYRYNNSLATCHIWASTEDQAEKKFKARKEFDYNPEYDRDRDEGNIRSIYVYQAPKPRTRTIDRPRMDRLIKFCLPIEIQKWLNQYPAPGYEYAFAKDIPTTKYNFMMTEKLAKIIPLRRKYRGKSRYGYTRPRDFCHKEGADRFALYFK